jgi:HTH-type transcriptional regulator/antitoxin HipB
MIIDMQARTSSQLGAVVRRIRKAQGLSQASLGEKVGLRQATISKLESGEANVRLQTLLDAMSALGLEFVVRSRVDRSRNRPPKLEEIF